MNLTRRPFLLKFALVSIVIQCSFNNAVINCNLYCIHAFGSILGFRWSLKCIKLCPSDLRGQRLGLLWYPDIFANTNYHCWMFTIEGEWWWWYYHTSCPPLVSTVRYIFARQYIRSVQIFKIFCLNCKNCFQLNISYIQKLYYLDFVIYLRKDKSPIFQQFLEI